MNGGWGWCTAGNISVYTHCISDSSFYVVSLSDKGFLHLFSLLRIRREGEKREWEEREQEGGGGAWQILVRVNVRGLSCRLMKGMVLYKDSIILYVYIQGQRRMWM